MRKYDYAKKAVVDYFTPWESGWNCHFLMTDPEEIINCAECGAALKFKEAHKSLLIRAQAGNYRYAVCTACSRKEEEERRRVDANGTYQTIQR